jgi:hypothetical protein
MAGRTDIVTGVQTRWRRRSASLSASAPGTDKNRYVGGPSSCPTAHPRSGRCRVLARGAEDDDVVVIDDLNYARYGASRCRMLREAGLGSALKTPFTLLPAST